MTTLINISIKNKQKFFQATSEQAKKLKFTNRSLYEASTTEQANHTTNLISKFINCSKSVITETSSGIGCNTVSFAKQFKKTQPIELDPITYGCLINNCSILKVKINSTNDDCVVALKKLKQDVIFLDPPWGGINYKDKTVNLLYGKVKAIDLVKKYSKCKLIVIKAPLNINLKEYKIKEYTNLYITVFKAHNGRPLYQLLFYTNEKKKSIPRTIKVNAAEYKQIKYKVIRSF